MPHAMDFFSFMMLKPFSSHFNVMPVWTVRQQLVVLKINRHASHYVMGKAQCGVLFNPLHAATRRDTV